MDIQPILRKAKESMQKGYEHAQAIFATFRVDRIDPSIIKETSINHYGVPTPLYQVATITLENPTTLSIKAWDKKLLPEITKSLIKEKQDDFTIAQRDTYIQLHRRPLTEERRTLMTKELATKAEEARISIRNVRKHTKQDAKELTNEDAVKLLETKLQELTNDYIEQIDGLYKEQSAQIMKV